MSYVVDYSSVAAAYLSLTQLCRSMVDEGKIDEETYNGLEDIFDRGTYSAAPLERAFDAVLSFTGWVDDDSVALYLAWVANELKTSAPSGLTVSARDSLLALLGSQIASEAAKLEANPTPIKQANDVIDEIVKDTKDTAESYALQGAAIGAASGFLLGAPVFGIGGVPGAVIGGVIGGALGSASDKITGWLK